MAQIHRVARAQQRYATVPVIDETTGQQKVITTTRTSARNGRQVLMRVTRADKDHPLDPESCERCRAVIEPGMPYKWIKPKSGPYGGARRVRCTTCPDWRVWEYSASLSSRLAQISHEFWDAIASAESEDDVHDALNTTAEAVRDIATEKQDSAQNIEDGFGHATSQSEELTDIADQLEGWADEIEQADVPEFPDGEDAECEECEGTGGPDGGPVCEECGGDGTVAQDEPTEDQLADWRAELESELSIVDESPV